MMDLKQEMKERCAYIEQALEQAVPEQKDFPPVIFEAMLLQPSGRGQASAPDDGSGGVRGGRRQKGGCPSLCLCLGNDSYLFC